MADATIDSLSIQINADAGNAVRSLNRISRALENLGEIAKSIKGLDDVSNFLRSLKDLDGLTVNLNGLSRVTNNLTTSNIGASRSYIDLWARLRMGYGVVRGISNLIGDCITKSAEYTEDMNLFSVSLGKYAEDAYGYAKTVGDAMGIDEGKWARNQGVFMSMTRGFGVTDDRAYEMSQGLTQLGYDYSSFFNITVDEAMQKLNSGLAGEIEPLRRLGVDLSQAKIEAVALSLGITKSFRAMNQAEKSQLRYYAMMTQLTHVQGDMARTLESPSNMLRILKSEVEKAGRAIGNLFIPALQAVLPYLIAVARTVRDIANSLATVFGAEIPEITGESTGIDDIKESLDEATESAKKFKNVVLGFDELNVLTQSKSGNGKDEDNGGWVDFELPQHAGFLSENTTTRVSQIVEDIKNNINEILNFIGDMELVAGVLLTFSGANIPLGLALIAGGFATKKVAGELNWDSVPTELSRNLNTIESLLAEPFKAVGAMLAFSGVNIPLGIAMMASGVMMDKHSGEVDWNVLPENIRRKIGEIESIVGLGLTAIGAIIAFSGINIPLGIAMLVGGLVMTNQAIELNSDAIGSFIEENLDKISGILGGASLVIGAILTFSGANIPLGIGLMALGATGIGSAVALNWDAIVGFIKEHIDGILDHLGKSTLVLGAILTLSGANIPLGIGLLIAGVGSFVTSAVLQWNSVTNTIADKVKAITNVVSGALLALGAILFFTGVGTALGIGMMAVGGVGLAMSGIIDWDWAVEKCKEIGVVLHNVMIAIENAWNKGWTNVGNFFIDAFNLIINGVNVLLGLINRDWEIDLIPKLKYEEKVMTPSKYDPVATKRSGFEYTNDNLKKHYSTASLAAYASGGFPEQGEFFIARENGAEMVGTIGNRTAVANNDQIVQGIKQGVKEALFESGNGGNWTIQVVDTDGNIKSETIISAAERRNRRDGKTVIPIGV